MVKRRLISAHSDLKTGFFCKLLLVLGVILFIIYLVQLVIPAVSLGDTASGALLAFAILCIGLGFISYFFSCQFAKLSQIAEEVEQDESLLDEEDEKEHK
jgi:hypothetical protein